MDGGRVMSTGTGLLGGEGGGTYGEDGEARTSLGTQGRGGAQTSGGAAATYVPENSVSRPLSGEFGKGGDGQVGVDSQSAGAGGGGGWYGRRWFLFTRNGWRRFRIYMDRGYFRKCTFRI